jgi:hypothetical protein
MTTHPQAIAGVAQSRRDPALPAIAALFYPLLLAGLFHSAEFARAGHAVSGRILGALALLAVFAVPALALISAARWGVSEWPDAGAATARRLAHLAFASPPLFTLIGVLSYMAGWPDADYFAWIVIWVAAIAWIAWRTSRSDPATMIAPAPTWLRVSHGVVASLVLIGFISLHLFNHLAGLWSAETHIAVMKTLRVWYRQTLVEPALVVLMLFMVVSGLALLRARLARSANFYETLQTASGAYLFLYIPGHMNSVFLFQRAFIGKDSDFWFASGGTAGLLGDPWNVRLLPHYALGVWAIATHAACGLRQVMLAHDVSPALANRITTAFSILAAVLAIALVLPLCRVHLL